jgi:hypothetical protein
MPENTSSLLDCTLDEALKTDFFTWFQLRLASGMEDAASRQGLAFQPEGDAFHDLVTVSVTLGEEGRIVAIDLLLARAFVDDPRIAPFARDIAKSFLWAAAPAADRGAIAPLADEIEFRPRYGEAPVLRRASSAPDLPSYPSDVFRVFSGLGTACDRFFSDWVLRLDNVGFDSSETLIISIRRLLPAQRTNIHDFTPK